MGEPGPQSKRKRSDSVDRRLQFAQWPRRYSNAFTVLTQAFYSCTHENTRKYSRCRNTSLSHFRKISRGRSMKIMKEREIASLCNLSNITKTDLNLREEKIDSLKRPIIETLQICCQLGCQLRNNAFFERDAAKKNSAGKSEAGQLGQQATPDKRRDTPSRSILTGLGRYVDLRVLPVHVEEAGN